MSSDAQRITNIESSITKTDHIDKTKVIFNGGGRASSLTKDTIKNGLLETNLNISGQSMRFALGCVIENRTTNSLETIESWLNGSMRTINAGGNVQDSIGRDPVIYTRYQTYPSSTNRTDGRDLSYYFVQINTRSKIMFIGKVVRGTETILGQKSVASIGNDYGKLSFSCYQTGANEVTISARLGTPYTSLPYTILERTDSNNFLASQESVGRFGIIFGGGVGTELIITNRSKEDKFAICGSGEIYTWQGANPTNPTPGEPSINDPNPPGEGASTVISSINGVTLSYDNAGEFKDCLKINNILVRRWSVSPTRAYVPVNRFDFLSLGWAPIAAANDARISSRALLTAPLGQRSDTPTAIILRKINSNFITFFRVTVATNGTTVPVGTWVMGSSLTAESLSNFRPIDGWLAPTSQTVYNVETILNFDLNKDTIIGAPGSPPPAAPGTTNISTSGEITLLYNNTGNEKDLLQVSSNLETNQFITKDGNNINYAQYLNNSYEALGAATFGSKNYIAWKAPLSAAPTVNNAVEVLASRPNFSNSVDQISDIPMVTSIAIRFSVPVTGINTSTFITDGTFKLYKDGVAVSLRNATLSGSGANYTLTLSSTPSLNPASDIGIYELRIFKNTIVGTINGQQVTMKQPSSIYWGRGRSRSNNQSSSLVIWEMSSSWAFVAVNSILSPNSSEYYQAESNFNLDFNKDGKIGNPVTPPPETPSLNVIERSGNTVLSVDLNTNNLLANNSTIVTEGSPVKFNNSSWEYLAAENIAGVNCLLSKSKQNGGARVIKCDANWSSTSIDPVSLPNTDAFFATETLFNVDIDKDGLIGRPLPPVIIPSQTGSGLVLSYNRQGEGSGLLKVGSTLVKTANNENVYVPNYDILKWQPVSAGVVDGVNTIVWKFKDNGYLHFWRLNGSWKQTSSDGWYAPNSAPFYAIETLFGIDFNNDGKVGDINPPPTPPTPPSSTTIESLGNVRLAYNNNDVLTANGTVVKFNNIPLKRTGTDWAYLAAENISGTNTLLSQYKPTGYLHFLQFDNNWNSTGGSGWYAPNSSDFLAAEFMFEKDIDGNGITGPSISFQSNFEESLEAVSNQTIPLSVTLNTNLSETTVTYLWQYNIGSGWVDWTLPQTNSRTSSSISAVFLPTYTTLKIRCKASILFAPNSLALSVFGGNYILTSKELTITKKAETNYIVVRSPSPLTFTYNRGSSFSLDSLPQYIQDNIAIITGGDLSADYITGIPSSWTPLCRPLEVANCNAQKQAVTDGVYGTRLLKSGLTYTLYPRTLSFRPFIMDFENLS